MPQRLRVSLTVLLLLVAAASVVAFAGGPDPLGDAGPAVFAVLLLAWLSLDLRATASAGKRRLLWIGVAAAGVAIAASAADALL